jgi:signal transduction histidine kinase
MSFRAEHHNRDTRPDGHGAREHRAVGSLELLKKNLDGEESRFRRVNEANQIGAGSTIPLVSFSRQGKQEPTVININCRILDSLDVLGRLLGETIKLTTILHGDVWPVRVHPSEIADALLTLAINARDAMHKGGSLVIGTQNACLTANDAWDHYGLAPGEYVRLSVSDTGCGEKQEVLAVLGLARIHKYIRQSGGTTAIHIEPGRGTTVNLYLPRFASNETPEGSDASASALPAGKMWCGVRARNAWWRSEMRSVGVATC